MDHVWPGSQLSFPALSYTPRFLRQGFTSHWIHQDGIALDPLASAFQNGRIIVVCHNARPPFMIHKAQVSKSSICEVMPRFNPSNLGQIFQVGMNLTAGIFLMKSSSLLPAVFSSSQSSFSFHRVGHENRAGVSRTVGHQDGQALSTTTDLNCR